MEKKRSIAFLIIGLFNVVFSVGGLLFWFRQFAIGSDGVIWAIFFIPCYILLLISGILMLTSKFGITLAIILYFILFYFSIQVFGYHAYISLSSDLSYYLQKSILYYLNPFNLYTFTSWTPNIYITVVLACLILYLSYVKIKEAPPHRKTLNKIVLGLLFFFTLIMIIRSSSKFSAFNRDPLRQAEKYRYARKYDEAITYFTKYIETNPTDRGKIISAYLSRAGCFEKKGDFDQAIADYTKIIEIDPSYYAPYWHRSKLYFEKKEYNTSWDDIHKIEKLGMGRFLDQKFLEELKKASGREN